MTYDLTDEVKAIGDFNIEGNIIPIEWFSHIRLPNNKPDLVSIILLSDIVYWYRPTTLRDERSGKIIGYRKKFKSDLLQKGYKDLEEFFGLSKNQIKDSLQRLEKLNLIKRIFRNINSNGSSLANVMFIQIFPANIRNITEKTIDMIKDPHTSEDLSSGVRGLIPTPPRINPHTYTETTTNTTTNTSLSLLQTSKVSKTPKEPTLNSLVTTKEKERENEMLKIWNEIVEEKNKTVIKLTSKREQALNLRFKEFFNNDILQWKEFCQKIASSKFLMGEVTNFKAQLDWVLKEDNLLKILENSYLTGDRIIVVESILMDETEDNEKTISDPIWRQTRTNLKKQLGEGAFNSWFINVEFENIINDTVHLVAPTKFIKGWIMNNYIDVIKQNFNVSGANIQEVLIQTV